MADKMAAVQGKVTAFIGLTKESLDGASDSLDGDSENNLLGYILSPALNPFLIHGEVSFESVAAVRSE